MVIVKLVRILTLKFMNVPVSSGQIKLQITLLTAECYQPIHAQTGIREAPTEHQANPSSDIIFAIILVIFINIDVVIFCVSLQSTSMTCTSLRCRRQRTTSSALRTDPASCSVSPRATRRHPRRASAAWLSSAAAAARRLRRASRSSLSSPRPPATAAPRTW